MCIRLRSQGTNICFVCCYAPYNGHLSEIKETFYDNLQNLLDKIHEATFIGGDFNARIHHRYMNESDIVGPNIFGRGREYLDGISASTKENTDLFVDSCHSNSLRISNTDFQNPPSKQATFRENTTPIGTPFVPDKYAHLDFWATTCKQKNECTDVQSRTDLYMHSDHYMVEIQIRIKLAAHKMTDCSKVPKYKKPNASQWQNYNDSFASLFASSPPRNSEFWKSFNGAIRTAARNCLSKETPKGKTCYISQSTWNLIDRRQALHIAGKHDEWWSCKFGQANQAKCSCW